jgi:altronate dehydratase large subunit
MQHFQWEGYLRKDGRKGIRNYVMVVYLAECAHHVAREISSRFKDDPVQLIGYAGCDPSAETKEMMNAICIHPNIGAVLLISTGNEGFDCKKLEEYISQSGRPVSSIVIQEAGGTGKSINRGVDWIEWCLGIMDITLMVPMSVDDLIVGLIGDGSDATSGLLANPAVGRAVNKLIAQNGTAVFAETAALIGLEGLVVSRAENTEVAEELKSLLQKSAIADVLSSQECLLRGSSSAVLTTIEERAMSTYSKVGDSSISGILKPADKPVKSGLYLTNAMPECKSKCGSAKPNVSASVVEMITCGCHMIIFTTGIGSVMGSAISPVIKICGHPQTYKRMPNDIDINVDGFLQKGITLDKVGNKIFDGILVVAAGIPTCSEGMGHQEFSLNF